MDELIVKSTKDDMKKVMCVMEEKLEAESCPARSVMEFMIAFEELMVNIVNYAYAPEAGPIWVRYCFEEGEAKTRKIRVLLEDGGYAYNPLEKEDPDISLSAKERSVGGLGIFMAKALLNEIGYQRVDGKNRLSFEKEFQPLTKA